MYDLQSLLCHTPVDTHWVPLSGAIFEVVLAMQNPHLYCYAHKVEFLQDALRKRVLFWYPWFAATRRYIAVSQYYVIAKHVSELWGYQTGAPRNGCDVRAPGGGDWDIRINRHNIWNNRTPSYLRYFCSLYVKLEQNRNHILLWANKSFKIVFLESFDDCFIILYSKDIGLL